MTNMGASALGAEMMTLLAPPFKWACNEFLKYLICVLFGLLHVTVYLDDNFVKSLGQDWVRTEAFSMVVNTPVDSTTYWAPASPHLMWVGSLLNKKTHRKETLQVTINAYSFTYSVNWNAFYIKTLVSELTHGKLWFYVHRWPACHPQSWPHPWSDRGWSHTWTCRPERGNAKKT